LAQPLLSLRDHWLEPHFTLPYRCTVTHTDLHLTFTYHCTVTHTLRVWPASSEFSKNPTIAPPFQVTKLECVIQRIYLYNMINWTKHNRLVWQ
jgi:hypothetical protein